MSKRHVVTASVAVAILMAVGSLAYFFLPTGSWRCENGSWRRVGRPLGQPPEKGCSMEKPTVSAPVVPSCDTVVAKDAKADEAYWRESGRLGRFERCMKDRTWYLKYRTPVGERLLEIAFAPGAACGVDGVKADCSQLNPPAGSQTSMSGQPDGSVLRLTKLEFRTK